MNITGGESLSLFEAQEAADIVQDAADEDVNMIFGTVINPELQDEIVVTVIATGFDDKPTSHGRKSGSTGFETSVNTSSNATSKDESFTSNSSNAQATDSVSERTHTTKEDDIQASLEIEKKDVQEEQDVNRLIYTQIIQHKSSDNISDDFFTNF